MPSFYGNSRLLPPTPPEYTTGFQSSTCHGFPYQQYVHAENEMAYGSGGRHVQVTAHPAASALSQPMPPSAPGMHMHARSYDLQLPPVQTLEPMIIDPYQAPPAYQRYDSRPQQKTKEEKPVGGVSAKLDYDMEWMTDFVAEAACTLVSTGRPMPPGFRSWVNSVLCATRLPSATIVLSLHYLSGRMQMLRAQGHVDFSDNHIYRVLTVALIMGSKFLDDNTFVNRSWADVSNIDIKTLNCMEMEWLASIEWCLHVDPAAPNGFNDWLQHWKDFEQRAINRGAQSLKLSPLDTNASSHAAMHKAFSPQSAMMSTFTPLAAFDFNTRSHYSSHQTPTYTPYDPWFGRRGAVESPASSAPHTGPTTPEYYGAPGIWAPLDTSSFAYQRRGPGFNHAGPGQSQIPAPYNRAPYTPFTPSFDQINVWTGHGIHCTCASCTRVHGHYWAGSHYTHQMVAA